MLRVVKWLAIAVVVVAAAIYAAFQLSPWPGVLLMLPALLFTLWLTWSASCSRP